MKRNGRSNRRKNCPVCTVQRIRTEEFESLDIQFLADISNLRELVSHVVKFEIWIVYVIRRRVERTQLNEKKVCWKRNRIRRSVLNAFSLLWTETTPLSCHIGYQTSVLIIMITTSFPKHSPSQFLLLDPISLHLHRFRIVISDEKSLVLVVRMSSTSFRIKVFFGTSEW